MAIITKEPEQAPAPRLRKAKKEPTSPPPETSNRTKPEPKPQTQTNPFIFWFYFILSVSLITLSVAIFSSFSSSSDPRSFFLSLPTPLRQHYSNGRTFKIQLKQNLPPTEIFALESGSKGSATEKVLILHGLGLSSFSFRKVIEFLASKEIHGVVFDLPGNGFSDKSVEVLEERGNGGFERLLDAYNLIKEKGIFWAFDNMVETGEIPYQEILSHYRNKKKTVLKPIALGSEEIGNVLDQLIETMGLAPVHLVLHDSSLSMVANWVRKNSKLVRSVTLLDTGSRSALPIWVLKIPVVREILLGSNFAYQRLVHHCCSKGNGDLDLEAHRAILKGKDVRRAIVGMESKLNSSFNVAEWGNLDGIKEIPIQLIWSEEWSKEGHELAEALSQAKFVLHSGGRWPQENSADELADNIAKFVSSLPKTVRKVEEEPIPEHIQKMFDEAKAGNHHHSDHGHSGHDHHHGHGHMHAAGYMDGYGLGHGWGT